MTDATYTLTLELTPDECDAVAQGLHLLRAANYWGRTVNDELAEIIDSATATVADALAD
jgi:hypothetical protein